MRYIDISKIKNNLDRLNDDYVVLKSNGYGFGLDFLIKILHAYPFLKLACIDLLTAIKLRSHFPTRRILLLGPFDYELITEYLKYRLELSINNINDLGAITGRNIPIQLCINSGMNRFGLSIEEVARIEKIAKYFNIVAIYSHNATCIPSEVAKQVAYFSKCLAYFPHLEAHFQATSIADFPMPFKACKRIGSYMFYQAMEIKAQVVCTRFVYKGEYIGYDFIYKMNKNGYIAILDIGYADGLVRKSAGYYVSINNNKYPLISKSCMNHSFVLVDETVKVGDEVDIIRFDALDDYAKHFQVSHHECYIAFGLSPTKYINTD